MCVCRSEDYSQPVQFVMSRLSDGRYVSFREAGAVPAAEVPAASRGAPDGDAEDEELMHTEEQVRAATPVF